jgi:hypothetical protein
MHRSAREEEIAAELKLSMEEYHEWLVDVRGVNLGSLESNSGEEQGRDLLKYISDNEENWPSRIVERNELEELLAQAIERMPQVERTILSLYYHEELTLHAARNCEGGQSPREPRLAAEVSGDPAPQDLYRKALAAAQKSFRQTGEPVE